MSICFTVCLMRPATGPPKLWPGPMAAAPRAGRSRPGWSEKVHRALEPAHVTLWTNDRG